MWEEDLRSKLTAAFIDFSRSDFPKRDGSAANTTDQRLQTGYGFQAGMTQEEIARTIEQATEFLAAAEAFLRSRN